jgi:hypothetical protein
MTIFDKIKAAWAFKGFAEKEFKEATMPTATGKPGWKTTEFWLNLASQAGVLWGAVHGFIPPQYAAIISTVGLAIYTVARTVQKAVSEVQATKQATATVTTTEPVTTVTTPA